MKIKFRPLLWLAYTIKGLFFVGMPLVLLVGCNVAMWQSSDTGWQGVVIVWSAIALFAIIFWAVGYVDDHG